MGNKGNAMSNTTRKMQERIEAKSKSTMITDCMCPKARKQSLYTKMDMLNTSNQLRAILK